MMTAYLFKLIVLIALGMAGSCVMPAREERTVTDPVCGREVTVGPEAISRNYRGEIFYFESDRCVRIFDSDPSYYYARYERDQIDQAWEDEDPFSSARDRQDR